MNKLIRIDIKYPFSFSFNVLADTLKKLKGQWQMINQATQQIFAKISYPQSPESKITNPQKSFDHPHCLKSKVLRLGENLPFLLTGPALKQPS